MAEQTPLLTRHVIFSGTHMQLEYNGPDPADLRATANPRVIVAFGPFDYPSPKVAEGWGSRSFTKRGIAHVCVFHYAEDWHQNDDFFDAMRACRTFLGPDIDITTYGFSMGGYGAMLGASALKASRVVAVSPQSSIDSKAVPFERRYDPQWTALAGWKHNLGSEVLSDTAEYIVLFDPLHNLDRKHEVRLPKPDSYTRCLIHGAGHAGLQTIIEMGIQEVLFDLLRGTVTPADMRRAYRTGRKTSFRYLRRVGTRLHKQKNPKAHKLLEMAEDNRFHRLIKKWKPFYG